MMFSLPQKNTRVDLGCEDSRAALRARDTDAQVLSRLTKILVSRIAAHDPVWIGYNLPFNNDGPTLENDDFVKLLPLRFVHVHDNDASFGSPSRGKVLLHKSAADNFKGGSI